MSESRCIIDRRRPENQLQLLARAEIIIIVLRASDRSARQLVTCQSTYVDPLGAKDFLLTAISFMYVFSADKWRHRVTSK